MKTEHMEVPLGINIYSACVAAVAAAVRFKCNMEFQFNDKILIASPDSNPETLAESYHKEGAQLYAAYHHRKETNEH